MIRSPKPSPLTSPASLTEKPEAVVSRDAIEREAIGAIEAGELEDRRRRRDAAFEWFGRTNDLRISKAA